MFLTDYFQRVIYCVTHILFPPTLYDAYEPEVYDVVEYEST